MISKPIALCQGVMDGAGSWMLAILRHVGWQKRWNAHIFVFKLDTLTSGAGKISLCV